MQERLKAAFGNKAIAGRITDDFVHTFHRLGLENGSARLITEMVIEKVGSSSDIVSDEEEIRNILGKQEVRGHNLIALLDSRLSTRADLIYRQIEPYIRDTTGCGIDFGCGDGRVTWRIFERLHRPIIGVDVRSYVAPEIKDKLEFIPVPQNSAAPFADSSFGFGVMSNVAHHESKNENILRELSRLIRPHGRLVVIETVPVTSDEIEFEVVFANDWLYNRCFHDADVPVPGTYETAEGWIPRFERVGFQLANLGNGLSNYTDLGFDQPTIRDRHVMYVFERI